MAVWHDETREAKRRLVRRLINDLPGPGWGNLDDKMRADAYAAFDKILEDESLAVVLTGRPR